MPSKQLESPTARSGSQSRKSMKGYDGGTVGSGTRRRSTTMPTAMSGRRASRARRSGRATSVRFGYYTSVVIALRTQDGKKSADDRARESPEAASSISGSTPASKISTRSKRSSGRIPATAYANVRKPAGSARAIIADFIPLTTIVLSGFDDQSVSVLSDGQPAARCTRRPPAPRRSASILHVGDVGHTLILGPDRRRQIDAARADRRPRSSATRTRRSSSSTKAIRRITLVQGVRAANTTIMHGRDGQPGSSVRPRENRRAGRRTRVGGRVDRERSSPCRASRSIRAHRRAIFHALDSASRKKPEPHHDGPAATARCRMPTLRAAPRPLHARRSARKTARFAGRFAQHGRVPSLRARTSHGERRQ